jgi:2-oxoglutarate ferredoxin oxidoreductase subunit beta
MTLLRTVPDVAHDPSDRLAAMALAQRYGEALHTGVFYRDPSPRPTYDSAVRARQASLGAPAPSRARVLEAFLPP